MIKKTAALLLSLVFLLGVTSCVKQADTAEADSSTVVTTEETARLPYEASVNADFGFDEGAEIASTVICDEEIATVTATGLRYEEGSALLHLEIENHAETDIQFDTAYISANHLMCGFSGFEFITAGESYETDIGFSYDELMPRGVTVLSEITIGEIAFTTLDEAGTATVLGPFTLRTNAYDEVQETGTGYEAMVSEDNQQKYLYSVISSAQEQTDIAEGVYATASFLTHSEYYGKCLAVELHNDTDENVSVSVRNPVVNGIRIGANGYYVVDIAPHCYAVHSSSIGNDCVPEYCYEALGFSDIQSISFEYALETEGIEATELVPSSLSVPGAKEPESLWSEPLYEEDGITTRSLGLVAEYEEDGYVGSVTAILLIENNTGKELTIQDNGTGDLLLNGNAVSFNSLYVTLPNETVSVVCYTTFDSMTDALAVASLSEITEGSMTLHLYDDETFSEMITADVPLL